MPTAARAPLYQPANFYSLEDLASSQAALASSQVRTRLGLLFKSQGMVPVDQWWTKARIALARRGEVESQDWCATNNVVLFVRCTGNHGERFQYPDALANMSRSLPVYYAAGRTALLEELLWSFLWALSQGKCIAIHCNESFHRGPLGLMAILKKLLGFEPSEVRELVLRTRTIYECYETETTLMGDYKINTAYWWAKSLPLWQPDEMLPGGRLAPESKARPKPSASNQGSSRPSAWSQGPGAAAVPPSGASSSGGQWVPAATPGNVRSQQARARAAGPKKLPKPNFQGEYLYRAMTRDLSEFVVPASASSQDGNPPNLSGRDLAFTCLRAIEIGSHEASPFLHFSWNFPQARHWWVKGRSYRNEKDSLMCRVPVAALRRLESLEEVPPIGGYFDFSFMASSQALTTPYVHDLEVEKRLQYCGHAHQVKEVLVCWRGFVPRDLFEVIHPDTGLFRHMLDPDVAIGDAEQEAAHAVELEVQRLQAQQEEDRLVEEEARRAADAAATESAMKTRQEMHARLEAQQIRHDARERALLQAREAAEAEQRRLQATREHEALLLEQEENAAAYEARLREQEAAQRLEQELAAQRKQQQEARLLLEMENSRRAQQEWQAAAAAAFKASNEARERAEEAERLRAKVQSRQRLLEDLRGRAGPTSVFDLDLRDEALWERIWACHSRIGRTQDCAGILFGIVVYCECVGGHV